MPPAPGKALVLARPQKTWVLSESQIRSDQVRSRAGAAIIENIADKSQQGGEKMAWNDFYRCVRYKSTINTNCRMKSVTHLSLK